MVRKTRVRFICALLFVLFSIYVILQRFIPHTQHLEKLQLPVEFIVKTKYCAIQKTESIRSRKVTKSECKENSQQLLVFGTRIVGNRTCPKFREDVLKRFYNGITPLQMVCVYQGFSQNEVVPLSTLTEKLPNDSLTLSVNDCPDFDALWIECILPSRQRIKQPLLLSNRKHASHNKTKEHNKHDKMHVLLLGVSSLSQSNFFHEMPRTYQRFIDYFRQPIQLRGFNRLGSRSAENLIPMLTGTEYIAEDIAGRYFDNWTNFIWDDFEIAGYDTLFVESSPSKSIFSDYGMEGFFNAPTQWFPSNFLASVEAFYADEICASELMAEIALNHVFDTIRISGSQHGLFAGCFLATSLLDAVQKRRIAENYNEFWNVDEIVANFLDQMHLGGELQRTVILFVSDHGPKYYLKMEDLKKRNIQENLPVAFLLLPDYWMVGEMTSKLITNTGRLVTAFDIYETLLDLVSVSRDSYRGLIFRTVPEERTCESAGIPVVFCSCYRGVPINHAATQIKLRDDLLKEINSKLEDICPPFENQELVGLDQLYENQSPLNIYLLRIRTRPAAIFEGYFIKAGKSAELAYVKRLDAYQRCSKESFCNCPQIFK